MAGRTLKLYLGHDVNFTEPMFVVVIMAIAASRPVVRFAENGLAVVAKVFGDTSRCLVAGGADSGPSVGLLHHRTCRDDDRGPDPEPQDLRAPPQQGARVRDAGTAVCKHLHRRHADPLRRATDPDGRGALGLGHHDRHDQSRLEVCLRDHRQQRALLPLLPQRADPNSTDQCASRTLWQGPTLDGARGPDTLSQSLSSTC
jgi:hypothetical protein